MIIEKCANVLAKKFGFNPNQVLRNFQIFSMYIFENTPKIPEEDIKNWYYLRDIGTHSALTFNYEIEEVILINEEQDWDEYFFEEMKQTEQNINERYKECVEKIRILKNSKIYKEIEPLLSKYLSLKINQRDKGTPIEYVRSLLFQSLIDMRDEEIEEIIYDILYAYNFNHT